jgi:hypothetical protein
MANSYSLALSTRMRDTALQAYESALNSKEYKVGSRHRVAQDIELLWKQVDKWDRIVCALSGQSPIVRKTIVPK